MQVGAAKKKTTTRHGESQGYNGTETKRSPDEIDKEYERQRERKKGIAAEPIQYRHETQVRTDMLPATNTEMAKER